ncbi:MAG TPA: glycosyltransferase [Puia sp.]|nr:glycosyltransferase [Puia sp.]
MNKYTLIQDIYMPPGQTPFAYSDGQETEDYLLDRISRAQDLSVGSPELAHVIRDWPTLYHLSPARADLLRPLASLLKGKKILEVGSGCGAITRYLGELGCQVLALEGSGKRARITRARCRDLSQVQVVCDNWDSFEWDGSFDIILLIGVLEYSSLFIKGDNPPLEMLRRCRTFLHAASPGEAASAAEDPAGHSEGQIVLAIENKLGLKYWAGAPEDHTGRPYDGILDLYNNDTAVTFGKEELARLLSLAGFPFRDFLYPFPDYKLPSITLTDAAFAAEDLVLADLLQEKFDYDQGANQTADLPLTRIAASVLSNGLMADMANSFLIVAGLAGPYQAGVHQGSPTAVPGASSFAPGVTKPGDNILAWSFNSMRKKCYCKTQLFTRTPAGALQVQRQRLHPEIPYPDDAPLQQHIMDEDYLRGRLLSSQALNIVTRPGWNMTELIAWAGCYYHILQTYSSRDTIPGQYLDLTPYNILTRPETTPVIFDQEWTCDEPLPFYFIFFRGIVYSLAGICHYASPAPDVPTGIIPLATQLVNNFIPFDATHLEECVRLEGAYFGDIPLRPGRPFGHGDIPFKKNWRAQYDTIFRQWQEARAALDQAAQEKTLFRMRLEQQVSQVRQEYQTQLTLLRQHVDWYQRTYEQRSLPGVLLQRRLARAQTSGKYLTASLLSSIQEKGFRKTLSGILHAVSSKGLSGWLHPRKALLPLMRPAPIPFTSAGLPPAREEDPEMVAAAIRAFTWTPKISFIMPVYNTPPRWLEKAVDSIRNQWYTNWELCIADDGSTHSGTRQLLQRLEEDGRIRVVYLKENKGISEASNAAIAIADGEFIALMDHDDEVTPDALFEIIRDLDQQGDADIIYTDECKVDEEGHLSDPFFKPGYSPELLLNMMYSGHLTLYKKSFLLNKVGLFRPAYDLSQDYDLMLRAEEKTTRIRHVEKILYHWRMTAGSSSQGEKPHARITNLAALDDAMKRRGIPAETIALPTANRVKIRLDHQPLVSIIIPTDAWDHLRDTLQAIYARTAYPHIEVVVVTNSRIIAAPPPLPLPAPGRLAHASPVYVAYDKPYNFSDKCNVGAIAASGELLVFYNDDVRPLEDHWLDNTIEYLFIPGVGGVSPRLVYEDDSIQYAGMATGVRGLTGTTFHGYPKDSTAYINFPQSVRDVSILSGACLAIRKEVFEEIGGFDAVNTPSSHSDVDLSFRLLEAGLRCVYTPYATLRHIGHLSLREHEHTHRAKDKADIYLLRRWLHRLTGDPYFTTSMRDHLYHDSPEPWRLYAPPAPADDHGATSSRITSRESLVPANSRITPNGRPIPLEPAPEAPDILLVSHDLSLSGAPIMLLQLCRQLLQQGSFVTVVCEQDGPARDMFLSEGVPVIIDTLLLRQHESFTRFARNFDHIVCNTIITWPVARQISQLADTLWWIHEAALITSMQHIPEFLDTFSLVEKVIVPSEYALQFVRTHHPQAKKIYYGYPDIRHPFSRSEEGEKITFSVIGSIEPRKGQDILIAALQRLSPDTLRKIEICLAGRPHDAAFTRQLQANIRVLDHVCDIRFMGETSHPQCLDLIRRSDVIICPSRDDPFPVVIVEALCLGKPCIVSTHTGFAELITPGEDGFVFSNGDSRGLAGIIGNIAEAPGFLPLMEQGARRLYEEYMTLEKFERRWMSVMTPDPSPKKHLIVKMY